LRPGWIAIQKRINCYRYFLDSDGVAYLTAPNRLDVVHAAAIPIGKVRTQGLPTVSPIQLAAPQLISGADGDTKAREMVSVVFGPSSGFGV
jgi:hypothetical protein